MPFEVSFLYFLSTVALLVAGVAFLRYWFGLVNHLHVGDVGYALSRVITGVFLILTTAQAALVVMAWIFWTDPNVLPRGMIGLAVQVLYLTALLWGVFRLRKIRT